MSRGAEAVDRPEAARLGEERLRASGARPSGRRWCPRCTSAARSPRRRSGAADGEGRRRGRSRRACPRGARHGRPRRARARQVGAQSAASSSRWSQSRASARGSTSSARAALAQDEAELAAAMDRQDRVRHRAEARHGEQRDDRLAPVRELHGDDVAGTDAERRETGRHALRRRGQRRRTTCGLAPSTIASRSGDRAAVAANACQTVSSRHSPVAPIAVGERRGVRRTEHVRARRYGGARARSPVKVRC